LHHGHRPAASSDEGLLFARIKRGDERAFEELYHGYHARLARFLINLLRRPQMVEEVLNDTMLVVWEKPDSFRGASKLSTWIFAIAYRKAMKALRKLDEPVEPSRPDMRECEGTPADDAIWHGQRDNLLRDAIQQLSVDHRAVVDLTYFHEMSYREIADVVGCPVDTVKTRMFHARRHLRRLTTGDSADWY
jgi:RNA polymerase sigma-70 factor (ECF subfamily)